jgi:uncharacterized coiled-coil DUF342 family protein
MKYREKLLDLILNATDEEMIGWIQSQPLLEQPDIFRELNELAHEAAEENGDDINEAIPEIADFDEKINEYEDSILSEKLAEEQYHMALENQQKAVNDVNEAIDGVRKYVIECIVTNAPNAKEMKELAGKIIELEKKNGVYDPENWKAINL